MEGAEHWSENLDVAGGGWRMPTRAELKTLYRKGAGMRNMTDLLKTTGWEVWTSETQGLSLVLTFGFKSGLENWGGRDYSVNIRAFAVRPPIHKFYQPYTRNVGTGTTKIKSRRSHSFHLYI